MSLRSVIPVVQANQIGGRVVKNTTRVIYKRCIFLRVKSEQHVSAIYSHHQVLCQLRFHYRNCVKCVMVWRSQHQIFVEPRSRDCDNRQTHRVSTIYVSTILIHPHTCHLSSHYRSLTLYVPPQARLFLLRSSIDSLTTATSQKKGRMISSQTSHDDTLHTPG